MKKTLKRLSIMAVGLSLFLWSCKEQSIDSLSDSIPQQNNAISAIMQKYSLRKDMSGIVKKENSFNFKSKEELELFLQNISKRDTIKIPISIKNNSKASSAKVLPYDDGNDYYYYSASVYGGGSVSTCNNISYWVYEYDPITQTYNYVLKFKTACGLGYVNTSVNYGISTVRNRSSRIETKTIVPNSLSVYTALTGTTIGFSLAQGQTTVNGYGTEQASFRTDIYLNLNLFTEGVGTMFTLQRTIYGTVNVNGMGTLSVY